MKNFLSIWLAEDHRDTVPDVHMRLRWLRDPLSHPAIAAMSSRELGDLPFDRGRLVETAADRPDR